MKYTELVESGATDSEKQAFLVDGEMTTITIRIPKNLKDAAAEAAALKSTSFSSHIRRCLIEDLLGKEA